MSSVLAKLILLVSLVSSIASAASDNDSIAEAQIIAKVKSVKKVKNNLCKLQIHEKSIRAFNAHALKPLFVEDVLFRGVLVGKKADGTCRISANEEISGVVIMRKDGSVILEDAI